MYDITYMQNKSITQLTLANSEDSSFSTMMKNYVLSLKNTFLRFQMTTLSCP